MSDYFVNVLCHLEITVIAVTCLWFILLFFGAVECFSGYGEGASVRRYFCENKRRVFLVTIVLMLLCIFIPDKRGLQKVAYSVRSSDSYLKSYVEAAPALTLKQEA